MNTKVKNKRNGKIELLRFVFCLIIVLFHINKNLFANKLVIAYSLNFFKQGYLGVEFFFIVSGFLLAKSAFKPDTPEIPLGSQSVTFIKRKILSFFSPHTIAFILTFIVVCITKSIHNFDIVRFFARALPSYFLLNRVGFSMSAINGVEWYISCMLIAMLFLFPLCRRFKTTFTNVIAPLVSIFLLGWIFHKYGSIGDMRAYTGITFKCMLRAIAELCLGTTAYSISCYIAKCRFSEGGKVVLTIIEAGCVLFSLYFTASYEKSKYAYMLIFALSIAIILIFSGQTLGNEFFSNRFFIYLGKLSLPVYLIQSAVRNIIVFIFPALTNNAKLCIVVIASATIVCGVGLMYLSVPLDKLVNKTLSKITSDRRH